jgi:hypothetical protein
VAVAQHTGEATLLASLEEGWHTIVPEFTDLCNVERQPIRIVTMSLDDLIAQHPNLNVHQGPARVVIKIDAEGAEPDILRGGTETLRFPAVRALIMECTGGPEPFRERSLSSIRLLREAGWEVVVITHKGLRSWQDSDADTQVNILASR